MAKVAELLKTDERERDELGRYVTQGQIDSAVAQINWKAGREGVPKAEIKVASVIPSGLSVGAKGNNLVGSMQGEFDENAGKGQTVKLRHLIGTQTSVRAARVKELVSDIGQTEGEAIEVMRGADGKMYLVDGHHRVAAMSLLGIREADAIVYEQKVKKSWLASLLKAHEYLDTAAHSSATSDLNLLRAPTEGQAKAGNYKKGHWKVSGLSVAIENPAGSKRRPEWPPMTAHYGYVKGTEGADGDHVDVFLKPSTPNDWAGTVYVIDQTTEDGTFDEHKCMIGWRDQASAERAYLGNYTKGWKLGTVTALPWAEFKQWLKGDTTKPLGKRFQVKVAALLKADERGRDEAGRYTAGGGSGEATTPAVSPERVASALAQASWKAGREGVPSSEIKVTSVIPSGLSEGAKHNNLVGSKQGEFDENAGKGQTVKLRHLIGTQTSVRVARVKELVSDISQTEGEAIEVMRGTDGKMYLVDGHHRVAAMSLLGIREADAIVYQQKTKKVEVAVLLKAVPL